jgi:type II secretory pathway pseudopilin PulG
MVRLDSSIPHRPRGAAFTLMELLVVIATIAVLASLMMPALGRAQAMGRSSACLSNLRQIGVAWHLYLGDHGDRFPDRRDLKRDLVGGYQPWSTWPKSDPRAGWSAVVLGSLLPSKAVWQCPGVISGPIARLDQVRQWGGTDTNRCPEVTYWMWRFDRVDDPVPADNFWGRIVDEALAGWLTSGNPLVVPGGGLSEVELVVDPYFPSTIPAIPESVRGRAAHPGVRNRLWMDGHADRLRDRRLR